MNGLSRHVRIGIVCLLSVTLVSACGWRLRGTLTLPEGLDTVYLNNQSSSQALPDMMRQLLEANNVNLADSASAAQLIVNLSSYEEERRVISIGSNTLVTEYELIAEADYSVEDTRGNMLLPPDEASIIRSYEFDQDNVLGKAEEERLIQEEMRRDLAQQIIRRLRFMELNPEVNAPGPAPQQ